MNPRAKALLRDVLRAQTIIVEVLLLPFPFQTANRHAVRSGELHDVWHGQSLPYSHLPLNDALPGSRSFRVGRLPLIRQQQQQCCCYLIYKLPVLWRSGAAARWSRLHTPVETGTPPRRRAKSAPFRFRAGPAAERENCTSLLCPPLPARLASPDSRGRPLRRALPLFRILRQGGGAQNRDRYL